MAIIELLGALIMCGLVIALLKKLLHGHGHQLDSLHIS